MIDQQKQTLFTMSNLIAILASRHLRMPESCRAVKCCISKSILPGSLRIFWTALPPPPANNIHPKPCIIHASSCSSLS